MNSIKNILKSFFSLFDLELKKKSDSKMPIEFSAEEIKIINLVKNNNLSMVSEERLWATAMACKHVIQNKIEGAFVECGVWRGGNAIIAASIFKLYGVDKEIYLFDTFSGMVEPSSDDIEITNNMPAMKEYLKGKKDNINEWCYASLDDVKQGLKTNGLLNDNIKFIVGDVCETLNKLENLPNKVAVLRLDTDWYESTKQELEVLYPLLEIGGVLMIDDYGHWAGAKKATDEYFSGGFRPLLQYIDYSGRSAVKIMYPSKVN